MLDLEPWASIPGVSQIYSSWDRALPLLLPKGISYVPKGLRHWGAKGSLSLRMREVRKAVMYKLLDS